MSTANLLFHSPCFDGIASAVLTGDYLRQVEQWTRIVPAQVDYNVRDTWLTTRFEVPTAVVDFLYHPGAAFWSDHHRSAFLTEAVRADFGRRAGPSMIYDARADSCAGLLWRHFAAHASHRNSRFAELVWWAERIDAARYESVEEALSFEHPALRIHASLAAASGGYSELLVRLLGERSLEEVSVIPEVRVRFEQVARSMKAGLARVAAAARLEDDVVVFDVDGRDVMIPRYSPYRFFPNARYSIGLVRGDKGSKITAMRNPWIDFESVPLGDIFTRHGGGGHQRVASTLVPPVIDPRRRLELILSDITTARDTMVVTS